MTLLLAVLQHATEGAEQPNVFALTTGVMFWTMIIFLVLLFVLSKFAFPHILGWAAAREQRIQEALDQAARDREEAQRLIEEQKQALIKARDEAHQVVSEAHKDAERVRRDMIAKAQTEQDEVIARAKKDIESERAKAIDSLCREAVDLAIAAAAKLVEKRLDSAEDRRIVSDFLAEIKTSDLSGKR